MKRFFIIILFLVFYCSLSGTNVQSLKDSLKDSKGLDRAEFLYDISKYYYLHDHDSALFFVDLAINEYEIENKIGNVVLSQLLKAAILRENGLYDSSIYINYKAIDWAEANSDTLAAIAYFELANTYELLNNYENAKVFYKKAISSNFKPIKIIATGNLGNIFKANKDYDSAKFYLRSSLKEQILLDTSKYVNRFNIAVCRSSLAGLLYETGDYTKGINIFKQNSVFFKETNSYPALIIASGKIAKGYQLLGQNNMALMYYTRAIHLADSLNLSQNLANAYSNISDFFVKNEDYKNAYFNYYDYHELSDSLVVQGYKATIAEMEVKYSLKEKNILIVDLKKEKQNIRIRSIIIIVSLLFLSLLIILMINNRRLKLKSAKALADAKSNMARIKTQMTENELKSIVASLRQKSAFIEELEAEVKKFSINNEKLDLEEKIQLLRKTRILTDEDWERYNRTFNEIHPMFCNSVENFDDLSNGDKRQLIFIKLGLKQKEIAHLMGISSEGAKKARQRLSKKIGLDSTSELKEYVEGL